MPFGLPVRDHWSSARLGSADHALHALDHLASRLDGRTGDPMDAQVARDILHTLANGTMTPDSSHTPIGEGITRPTRTTIDGVACIVKHESGVDRAAAERMVYAVATISAGLAIVPPTVVRYCADGHRVSVQAWRSGASFGCDNGRSLRGTLRSDVVGAATVDYLTGASSDRHQHNWLVDYSHTDCADGCTAHHGRVILIDGGRAFRHYDNCGVMMAGVSGHLIPAYLHDHMTRLIAGAPILYRMADECGAPVVWVGQAVQRAAWLAQSDRFPTASRY